MVGLAALAKTAGRPRFANLAAFVADSAGISALFPSVTRAARWPFACAHTWMAKASALAGRFGEVTKGPRRKLLPAQSRLEFRAEAHRHVDR